MSNRPLVARIRLLDSDMAFDLNSLLDRERVRLLVAREEMREDGVSDGVKAYNERVLRLKKLQGELARTIVEMGWYNPPFGEGG
jgi:hypothetical protein